ncbi:Gamma-glutamyl hydrolase [Rhynchospora pubera]|uniref:folate gamma-glutamyl hydrolase n=1 Tax=Rhynchospora pubera TaxID=906938 RepID=A0AAV8DMK9_9POAL|nr:Gamma-glutamyl hydrolase [Rhynchospora pubera]KAJ4742214.1 Gamma-glutamyl hydrolase [Rhynchospora pubera]KAJ4768441.1 Gamma-glutamyl hydrolase [Rhynchospora pubera]KAJ4797387.1 Gamma-glutamyl hydrolase [Rhynchospora pubera]
MAKMASITSLFTSLSSSFLFLFSFATSQSILLPTDRSNQAQNCPSSDPLSYNYPVIGIITHPGDGAGGRLSNSTNVSYIAASYVKFVEAAGARVVPIVYNEAEEIIAEKLKLVNGVIFTGGSAKTGPYFERIKNVFQIILDRNDEGEHFPLLAICLGFELVTKTVSKDNNILERFSAKNQASILQFVDNAATNISIFQRFSPQLIEKLGTDCLVMQNHIFGISPQRLQTNDALSNFFRILTTTPDKNGKIYVSSVQAYNYPVTALQWHPEKNVFEWGVSAIPHSEDAVLVSQAVGNYFISEARKSSTRPSMKKVSDNLIYNYAPRFSGAVGSGFDEVYLFQ